MTQTIEVKQLVTKDMIIADVLKKYPDVAVIMLEHGLHCVGCHANVFDTIEAGARVHGLDDETIDSMVVEINKFVAAENNHKHADPKGPAKTPKITLEVKVKKKPINSS